MNQTKKRIYDKDDQIDQDTTQKKRFNVTPLRLNSREKRERSGFQTSPIFFTSLFKRRNEDDFPRFTLLSDETILHVFKFLLVFDLVSLSKVCKYFKEITRDESLWKKQYLYLFSCGVIHFYPMNPRYCKYSFHGSNGKPTLVCTKISHYINTNDGKRPTTCEDYYLSTAERLYKLIRINMDVSLRKMESKNKMFFVSQDQKNAFQRDVKREIKTIDKRFLWIYKILHKNKYDS